jgi:cellobiose-specific phosphotransferase system component IIA
MKHLAILGMAAMLFACSNNEQTANGQNETELETQEAYTEEAIDLSNDGMPAEDVTRVSNTSETRYALDEAVFLPSAEGVQGNMDQMNTNLDLLETDIDRIETTSSDAASINLSEDALEKIAEAKEKLQKAREIIDEARKQQAEGNFEEASASLKDANEKMAEAEEKYMAALEKETGVEIEE